MSRIRVQTISKIWDQDWQSKTKISTQFDTCGLDQTLASLDNSSNIAIGVNWF